MANRTRSKNQKIPKIIQRTLKNLKTLAMILKANKKSMFQMSQRRIRMPPISSTKSLEDSEFFAKREKI